MSRSKNLVDPKLQIKKESVIEDNIIISGDLSEQSTVKKSVKRNKIINEDLPNTISYNNSDEKAEFTGIHRRLEQKMSRGQIKIDSTLDLHGMNQEEAKDATINFVRMAKRIT